MATNNTAPANKAGKHNNSIPYSPGSKQLDNSILGHKGPTGFSAGGMKIIGGPDPEVGTGPDLAKEGD